MTGLDAIKGEPLSGIAFVQDYVEFHFDGRVLRAFTRVSVGEGSSAATFPAPGSRDALCDLIGRTVENVVVRHGEAIELVFESRAVLRVPLSVDEHSGPEAAHYVPGQDLPIEVW